MAHRRVIAVVGPGGAEATTDLCDLAAEVGRALARHGFAVLTGGLDGIMAAAARGAAAEDGIVIGLLPGSDRNDASPDLTVALPTGIGQARNALVVRAAEGIVAVGGSWGTLSEIALAKRAGTPVVCLRGWRVVDETGRPIAVDAAGSPAEAVDAIAAALGHRG